MMGVERVESSSKTKATKKRMDKGVAGRSMMAKNRGVEGEGPVRQRPARETQRGGERWADVEVQASRCSLVKAQTEGRRSRKRALGAVGQS